jgi:hypothetical protein
VLKYSGLEILADMEFERYVCGPYSIALETDLEALDWSVVTSSNMIEDERIEMTREAISRGNDFLLALAIAVGVADYNQGISKAEIRKMVIYINPDLKGVAKAACDFAEARIWSK